MGPRRKTRIVDVALGDPYPLGARPRRQHQSCLSEVVDAARSNLRDIYVRIILADQYCREMNTPRRLPRQWACLYPMFCGHTISHRASASMGRPGKPMFHSWMQIQISIEERSRLIQAAALKKLTIPAHSSSTRASSCAPSLPPEAQHTVSPNRHPEPPGPSHSEQSLSTSQAQ
jgi:hypothetical protein